MQTSDSIVIIPTYNEKENIENIIRAVFGLEKTFHILVIEDNSPDGTADIVRRLQKEFPERLFMIERKGKLGLGTAYITGFKCGVHMTEVPVIFINHNLGTTKMNSNIMVYRKGIRLHL